MVDPRAGLNPPAPDGTVGDAEHSRGFAFVHSGKEPAIDHRRKLGVELGQQLQRIAEADDIGVFGYGGGEVIEPLGKL